MFSEREGGNNILLILNFVHDTHEAVDTEA